jgi:hypothetical protein
VDDEPASREDLIKALLHANATAKRVRGTVYYERAHQHIDRLLDRLEFDAIVDSVSPADLDTLRDDTDQQ